VNWSEEKEWRIAGDIDLSKISNYDLLAIVATRTESDIVRSRYGIASRLL
jgi:hypothetical protein